MNIDNNNPYHRYNNIPINLPAQDLLEDAPERPNDELELVEVVEPVNFWMAMAGVNRLRMLMLQARINETEREIL